MSICLKLSCKIDRPASVSSTAQLSVCLLNFLIVNSMYTVHCTVCVFPILTTFLSVLCLLEYDFFCYYIIFILLRYLFANTLSPYVACFLQLVWVILSPICFLCLQVLSISMVIVNDSMLYASTAMIHGYWALLSAIPERPTTFWTLSLRHIF